ncbi:LysR family transcriptional regulator [Tibeticola sp.]|jgi:DNA-binding transcriptional LysR family regulator|uniref:LysR family transcriptional regulator n=1 Tax=Tibeticola sp. TaxID=2005368 RepID=UPI00258313F8|nr:LysR family transcriptional regulator [Tibeticola sp.]MCI4441616.1 LysR family transcriptional regulator [Tibeticola sp.]
MQNARDVLSPEALGLIERVARSGSFAAAARELGLAPSALTYRVRRIEDALDVLLFDRSRRQAVPTAAARELLREGARILEDLDAIAQRVRRVATGWEAQLTIAADSVIDRATLLDLCEAFLAGQPPTRLRLLHTTLSGTLEALTSGRADLALGVTLEAGLPEGLPHRPLGTLAFVFAVAPHHPLAQLGRPLTDADLRAHRAVAVADSALHRRALHLGLLPGQDVFTVPDMAIKLQAQLRGLGAGYLPEPLARPHLQSGALVACALERPARAALLQVVWRAPERQRPGPALQWWLDRLENAATCQALLGQR